MVDQVPSADQGSRPLNAVIVGGGAGCEAMLRMQLETTLGHISMQVIGVAETDPEASGARFAREIGIEHVTTDYRDLLTLPDLDLIIELTGSDAVRDELEKARPRHVRLIDHFSARFFWDLHHAQEAVMEQRAEMKERVGAERERIKQIFDSIPDEIVVLDTDMVIQQVNANFLRSNGLEFKQVNGRHCYDVEQRVRGECQVALGNCPCSSVLRTAEPCSVVRKHFDSDGHVRYAAIVAAPILDRSGEVTGLIEMTRDITHRIHLEEELKATGVRLQQFMDMAPLAVSVRNRHGQIIEVNPATCALFGLSRSEIIGHTDLEILPAEAATVLREGDAEVLKNGQQLSYDAELTLQNNRIFLRTSKFPVLDADGKVSAVVGLSHDVTGQKEAEAALTGTREYLQNILDNAPIMVVTTDLEGMIVSFNAGAEAILGYDAGDVIDSSSSRLYRNPEDRAMLLRRVEKDGSAQDHETVLIRADGSEVTVSITLSELKDASGHLIGRIILGRDLSHRKALMDQIIQSERLAAVGRLAAGVAHEINNPLAVIAEVSGYLNDMVEGVVEVDPEALEGELRQTLPKILAHVKRGRSITSSLLSFSRKTEARVKIADVGASMEEVLTFMDKKARLAQVTIHREIPHHLPKVDMEELQLEEVLINLITNSIQAMAGRGHGNIWLDAEEHDGKISLTVRDDGPGIAEEVRDRLFDPFVSTKPLGQGTGLGLSICYGIVKRNDGEIRVESKPGEGALFKVILPVHKERDASKTPDN